MNGTDVTPPLTLDSPFTPAELRLQAFRGQKGMHAEIKSMRLWQLDGDNADIIGNRRRLGRDHRVGCRLAFLSTTFGDFGVLVGFHRRHCGRPGADDDRAEAVEATEFFLPRNQHFQVALAAHVEAIDDVFGDDHEEREVDGVHAFTQDGPLATALTAYAGTAFVQEGARVLKIVATDHARQSLTWRQRFAIASVDIANLALRNSHQADFVNAVLPAP